MDKNGLLLFMIICYAVPIYYVYFNYHSNHSVSNIICGDECKYTILFFMFLMGMGTLLYEMERNDTYSIILIGILLVLRFSCFPFYLIIYDSALLCNRL
jgi:hypothetical protein